MLVDREVLWLAQTNTWVIAPHPGGPAVVIDAPPDPEGIIRLLERNDLQLEALIVTHGHVDHMGAASSVADIHGATVFVHPDDDFLSLEPKRQVVSLFGGMVPGTFEPLRVRATIAHGDRLLLAGIEIEIRHTPGHTPGHCCVHLPTEGWLFSGDQLFAGSIGRTDLPGGSYETLLDSMATQVLTLPDEVRVFPGHGPETTIGRERVSNPFLIGLAP